MTTRLPPVAAITPLPPGGGDNTPPPGGGTTPPPGGGTTPPPGGGTTPPPPSKLECIPTRVPADEAGQSGNQGGGQADIATSGHLDLGAQIQNGQLVPSMKDDRPSPPVWVNPSSIVLSLQKKSEAPAGMEFIANAGSDIWLIPATQDSEVPWLGQNTMHETFIAETEGTLTWKLDSVDGPGDMAVFASGTFGGGVGERQFDSVGGPTTHTVPANTHAHPNWVFNAPGHYKVNITMTATLKSGQDVTGSTTLRFAVGVNADEVASNVGGGGASNQGGENANQGGGTKVVGRTPSGEPCDLPGLPGSGAEGVAPALLRTAFPSSVTAAGTQFSGTALGLSLALLVLALAATRKRGEAPPRNLQTMTNFRWWPPRVSSATWPSAWAATVSPSTPSSHPVPIPTPTNSHFATFATSPIRMPPSPTT